MNYNEIIADVYEALEKVKIFAPTYKALLARGIPRNEALKAIKFLMEVTKDEIIDDESDSDQYYGKRRVS